MQLMGVTCTLHLYSIAGLLALEPHRVTDLQHTEQSNIGFYNTGNNHHYHTCNTNTSSINTLNTWITRSTGTHKISHDKANCQTTL